ncbi:MAG: hypothetical protein EHM93_11810 [Bacteroidales bacterium]|nr:MAG: hypothetical protein EHM93_11810 [Bacteroidales bacterium]
MKKFTLTALIFSILIVFACNSKDSKKNKFRLNRESIIQEIITTSPRYKELTKGLYDVVIKNGGSSIGISLEGSPDAKKDKVISYSKTYDFTLYEMYTERKMNTTRFSFSPEKKQLYEYDAVNDTLKPIDFDKNLLIKFESFNK